VEEGIARWLTANVYMNCSRSILVQTEIIHIYLISSPNGKAVSKRKKDGEAHQTWFDPRRVRGRGILQERGQS
jgi:hypothetical protein